MTSPARPRSAPGRPRGANGEQTRAKVLAMAMELFAETGFRGTPLQRIAEQVGLSQAGLLHHFGSKNALLAEVLRRRDELDAGLTGGEPLIGWQLLDHMVELARRNATTPGLVRLFVTLSGEAVDPDHPGHAWLDEHLDVAVRLLTRALESGIAQGTVRAETPCLQLARSVVALMDGLQVQWLMDPAGVDMAATLADAVQAFRFRWELPAPG